MDTYNIELEKAIKTIKEKKAKLVCLQLPDGLKPRANEIEERITAETDAKVLIWLGSNFGACDIPVGLNRLGIDLLICWGHNPYHKTAGGW